VDLAVAGRPVSEDRRCRLMSISIAMAERRAYVKYEEVSTVSLGDGNVGYGCAARRHVTMNCKVFSGGRMGAWDLGVLPVYRTSSGAITNSLMPSVEPNIHLLANS
jgi:hypothetical protein